jgi:hypothetical protein
MKASTYWKVLAVDREEFLERFVDLLSTSGIRYCLIGGLAVNAYAEPVVSLDFDVVVDPAEIDAVTTALAQRYDVRRFGHTINVSARESDLRVQIQTDPRYFGFLPHATPRQVLGIMLPVARLEDVLQSKVWAALDPTRRPSKRQKDLADIARLLEAHPHLRTQVPEEITAKLV